MIAGLPHHPSFLLPGVLGSSSGLMYLRASSAEFEIQNDVPMGVVRHKPFLRLQ